MVQTALPTLWEKVKDLPIVNWNTSYSNSNVHNQWSAGSYNHQWIDGTGSNSYQWDNSGIHTTVYDINIKERQKNYTILYKIPQNSQAFSRIRDHWHAMHNVYLGDICVVEDDITIEKRMGYWGSTSDLYINKDYLKKLLTPEQFAEVVALRMLGEGNAKSDSGSMF
jgi:hypothetical protein